MIESRCGLLCKSCSFRESCNCSGCIETLGNPFYGKCPIANCFKDKGFENCGQCPDLPCELLYAYSYLDKEHGDNLPGERIERVKKWAKK